ncbi:LppX_LprAFG lipoprotein [Streptomyces sp. NPDC047043]|uniref:LppX_LprAFG lipoprotein n=1 Tax=Streptomyces sp. NPDC047043 TaxID=3154497 RepID=UPI0033FEC543
MTFPVRAYAPRRAAGAAGAVLLLAAGAVGCGSGAGQSSAESAAAAVARATKKTQTVTSVHYRLSGRIPEQGRVETEASVGTKPVVARVVTSTIGGDHPTVSETRMVHGVLYQRQTENGVAQQVHGRHWAGFGARARFTAAGGLKMDTGGLRDQVGHNPARDAAFLAAADDVRRTGTEKVDGVTTTHYTGTATVAGLRSALEGQEKKGLLQYDKLGVDELTLDVWIDGEDHVKRLRTQGFGRHGQLDLTVTFLDFGRPVTVRAPSAEDTVDLSKPSKQGRG